MSKLSSFGFGLILPLIAFACSDRDRSPVITGDGFVDDGAVDGDLVDGGAGNGGSVDADAVDVGSDGRIDDGGSTFGDAGGVGVDEPCECRQPPADPVGPPGDGHDVVFAINKLFLGDTDRKGKSDLNAWKSYGYNLDGYRTTSPSTKLCRPRGYAPPTIHDDGDDGIDNAFGQHVLPAVTAIFSKPTSAFTDAIADGGYTLILLLRDLGTGANYSGISAVAYRGAPLGTAPKWDGTQEWPIRYESLVDGDIEMPRHELDDSYVANRTWVGKADLITLDTPLGALPIRQAVITMDLEPDNSGAVNGTIAGVLEVNKFQDAIIQGISGEVLCRGDLHLVQKLMDQVVGAADMLVGEAQDPDKLCNGVSIGIGFEAKPVLIGAVADPRPNRGDEC